MKYKVWNLDVWGNKKEGYWINDRHELGEIELPETPEDMEILTALDEGGFISPLENLDLNLLEVIDFYPDYQINYDEMPQLSIDCEDEALLDAHKGV